MPNVQPPERIRLRGCNEQDLRQVMSIEKTSFNHPYDYWTFHYYLHSNPERFVVAEMDERVVGYIVYVVRNKKATIISIAVEPRFRGKGIGRSLLQHALSALENEASIVELQVGVDNDIATDFYRKFGFRALGHITNYYPDGTDALVMQKIIEKKPE